jgi:hypothetical protein
MITTPSKDNRGGDRVPSNPAPVSNPGAGSARTDGQAARYAAGIENAQDFLELQTQAPMNKSGVTTPKGVGQNAPTMNNLRAGGEVTPLDAFTQFPDEPGSNGALYGDGAGPEALASTAMLDMQNDEDYKKFKAVLPIYKAYAESPYASNSFRNFTRWADAQ